MGEGFQTYKHLRVLVIQLKQHFHHLKQTRCFLSENNLEAWFTSAAVTGRAIAAAALLGVLDGCSSSLDFFVAQGCGNTATRCVGQWVWCCGVRSCGSYMLGHEVTTVVRVSCLLNQILHWKCFKLIFEKVKEIANLIQLALFFLPQNAAGKV